MRYLRTEYPDATIDAMCMGWERMRDRYGIDDHAVPVARGLQPAQRAGRAGSDGVRQGRSTSSGTAAWVRGHDVVIIPGMGILDPALPTPSVGCPVRGYLLAACREALGAKVALVAVGADRGQTPRRPSLALQPDGRGSPTYRSFRDAARARSSGGEGVDVSKDFSVHPGPRVDHPGHAGGYPSDPELVAVGVMAYHGTQRGPGPGGRVYASYTSRGGVFTRWLLDSGHDVRLYYGDE